MNNEQTENTESTATDANVDISNFVLNLEATQGLRQAGRGAQSMAAKDFPPHYNRFYFRVVSEGRDPTEEEVAARRENALTLLANGDDEGAANILKNVRNKISTVQVHRLIDLKKTAPGTLIKFTKAEISNRLLSPLDEAIEKRAKTVA